MPLGVTPVCATCKTTASTIWRKGCDGEVLCNSCGVKQGNGNGTPEGSLSGEKIGGSNGSERGGSISYNLGPVRKSARLKPKGNRSQQTTKLLATKGKNRRVVFKKNPIRAPTAVSTVITTEYVFLEGQYWQTGDVVSVMDEDTGDIFYAQIRGFLQDQYSSKSAVITWLLPTTASPRDRFDPATYILGPEEDLPRPMEAFEFVCRATSEYYKAKDAPYPVRTIKPELGYVWTRFGPEIRVLPTQEEIFGFKDGIDGIDGDGEGSSKKSASEKKALKRKQNKSSAKKEKVKNKDSSTDVDISLVKEEPIA